MGFAVDCFVDYTHFLKRRPLDLVIEFHPYAMMARISSKGGIVGFFCDFAALRPRTYRAEARTDSIF